MDIINKELLNQKTAESKNAEVRIINTKNIMPFGNQVAVFNGYDHNANVSFFLVNFSKGTGPKKHRHPYEETFVILEGEIEAIVNGKTFTVSAGNIMIVPENALHEFSNKTDNVAKTINIHPTREMIQEWYTE